MRRIELDRLVEVGERVFVTSSQSVSFTLGGMRLGNALGR
jgi:hypothetical protein